MESHLGFRFRFRLGEISLLRLDSPELDLQNQIIIVGFDGI